jgi:MinD-like ATPase involved in chromosome partitioning or flagellar assembly
VSSGVSSPDQVRALLDSRLVLITGKGGTGKTTFASALALLATARGKRVLLAEIDSQRPALTPIFGREPGYAPVKVKDGLELCNLTWQAALTSFLTALVPSRRVVGLILSNKIVSRFLDFTPGSQEIVTLSALIDQVDKYDLVIADLPASGHAFSLLDVTRSALGLFRSGPVRARASELRSVLQAPTTRVALVALPEEMVVNETLETRDRLDRFELLSGPPCVFLNRATLPTLTIEERELIHRLGQHGLEPLQAEFVRAGRWEDELEQGTAESAERLNASMGREVVLVPPAPPGGVPKQVVESVAAHLGRLVGLTRRELQWS